MDDLVRDLNSALQAAARRSDSSESEGSLGEDVATAETQKPPSARTRRQTAIAVPVSLNKPPSIHSVPVTRDILKPRAIVTCTVASRTIPSAPPAAGLLRSAVLSHDSRAAAAAVSISRMPCLNEVSTSEAESVLDLESSRSVRSYCPSQSHSMSENTAASFSARPLATRHHYRTSAARFAALLGSKSRGQPLCPCRKCLLATAGLRRRWRARNRAQMLSVSSLAAPVVLTEQAKSDDRSDESSGPETARRYNANAATFSSKVDGTAAMATALQNVFSKGIEQQAHANCQMDAQTSSAHSQQQLGSLSFLNLCTVPSCSSCSHQYAGNSEATPVPSGTPQLSPHLTPPAQMQADAEVEAAAAHADSPFSAGRSSAKRAHIDACDTPQSQSRSGAIGTSGGSFSAYREPHAAGAALQLPANAIANDAERHYCWRPILASARHSSKRLLLDASVDSHSHSHSHFHCHCHHSAFNAQSGAGTMFSFNWLSPRHHLRPVSASTSPLLNVHMETVSGAERMAMLPSASAGGGNGMDAESYSFHSNGASLASASASASSSVTVSSSGATLCSSSGRQCNKRKKAGGSPSGGGPTGARGKWHVQCWAVTGGGEYGWLGCHSCGCCGGGDGGSLAAHAHSDALSGGGSHSRSLSTYSQSSVELANELSLMCAAFSFSFSFPSSREEAFSRVAIPLLLLLRLFPPPHTRTLAQHSLRSALQVLSF